MKKIVNILLLISLSSLLLWGCSSCCVKNHLKQSNLAIASKDFGPYCCQYAKRSYFFDFDRSQVKNKDIIYLKAHAKFLAKRSGVQILLEGNADRRGSKNYNYHLGMRRAKAIAKILEKQGVSKNQITIISYGKLHPIDKHHNLKAYQLNRRVDLIYR